MCEISSKVNIKVTVLVSLLLNPNMFINFTHFSIFSIADFEQVTDCWVEMVCMSQGTEHIAHNNFCSSLMAYCKQNQVLESIPADMYLLKLTTETLEQGVKYVQSYIFNNVLYC